MAEDKDENIYSVSRNEKLHEYDIIIYTSKGRAALLAVETTVRDFAKAVD